MVKSELKTAMWLWVGVFCINMFAAITSISPEVPIWWFGFQALGSLCSGTLAINRLAELRSIS